MMVCDTSGLLAALDDSQTWHVASRQAVQADQGPFLLSPFVLAELDYVLATRIGPREERRFLQEVAEGAYRLEPFSTEDLRAAVETMIRYSDAAIGLADASLVVLARRHGTNRILTLDQRHFRSLQLEPGKPFVLLPVDEQPPTAKQT